MPLLYSTGCTRLTLQVANIFESKQRRKFFALVSHDGIEYWRCRCFAYIATVQCTVLMLLFVRSFVLGFFFFFFRTCVYIYSKIIISYLLFALLICVCLCVYVTFSSSFFLRFLIFVDLYLFMFFPTIITIKS